MKTADEYVKEKWTNEDYNPGTQKVVSWLKVYAKEVLRDYDNWKAHKTPQLVENYIKEKGL